MKKMKFEARRYRPGPTQLREVYTDDLSKVPPLEPGFSEWEAVGITEVPDAALVIAIRKHGYAVIHHP